jgi:hypothetical protein
LLLLLLEFLLLLLLLPLQLELLLAQSLLAIDLVLIGLTLGLLSSLRGTGVLDFAVSGSNDAWRNLRARSKVYPRIDARTHVARLQHSNVFCRFTLKQN